MQYTSPMLMLVIAAIVVVAFVVVAIAERNA
jgi:hypothetical protein